MRAVREELEKKGRARIVTGIVAEAKMGEEVTFGGLEEGRAGLGACFECRNIYPQVAEDLVQDVEWQHHDGEEVVTIDRIYNYLLNIDMKRIRRRLRLISTLYLLENRDWSAKIG